VAKYVPDDRILIETDSPYLAPVPKRGKRNCPIYVRHVCERIAELRGVSVEKMAEITKNNAKAVYKIK
jgi:TatD DNase family protein